MADLNIVAHRNDINFLSKARVMVDQFRPVDMGSVNLNLDGYIKDRKIEDADQQAILKDLSVLSRSVDFVNGNVHAINYSVPRILSSYQSLINSFWQSAVPGPVAGAALAVG